MKRVFGNGVGSKVGCRTLEAVKGALQARLAAMLLVEARPSSNAKLSGALVRRKPLGLLQLLCLFSPHCPRGIVSPLLSTSRVVPIPR